MWQKIANEINSKFNLGENGAERCRQKFANLTKVYMTYIKNQKTTGSGHVDAPAFFEEMHDILGSKDKCNPRFLVQSSMEVDQPQDQHEDQEQEDPQEGQQDAELENQPENRYRNHRKPLKPDGPKDIILRELQLDREFREKQVKMFNEHMKTTENQRERLLTILENAFSKKRKRTSSDSE